jgi:DNA-directed RNA polymerase subunit RPC12/RpoP
MPKYSYFCKTCDEAYDLKMSSEEQKTSVPHCPSCGDGENQELYGVASDGDKSACAGCSGSHGCHH